MSETAGEPGATEQAGPRRLRPKHFAQFIAIAAVAGTSVSSPGEWLAEKPAADSWRPFWPPRARRALADAIDIQDFTADARKFMDNVDASYVSVRDGTSKTYSAYGLTGVPETFYLDRRGRAVFHSIGAVSKEDLEVGIG
jgi:hypothetical protein